MTYFIVFSISNLTVFLFFILFYPFLLRLQKWNIDFFGTEDGDNLTINAGIERKYQDMFCIKNETLLVGKPLDIFPAIGLY